MKLYYRLVQAGSEILQRLLSFLITILILNYFITLIGMCVVRNLSRSVALTSNERQQIG